MLFMVMLDTVEDKATISKIYEEYHLSCYHAALAVTKNPTMAEDAVHNTFLAVIRHKDEIFTLTGKKMRSKLVIIAKNKAIDILRAQGKYTAEPLSGMEEVADNFDLSTYVENKESDAH